jgi:hypothetical protein
MTPKQTLSALRWHLQQLICSDLPKEEKAEEVERIEKEIKKLTGG